MRVRLACFGLCVLAGCASPRRITEAFPPGDSASPWVLQGEVWSGTFAEAAPAMGSDAAEWERFGPTRAWLAVYCHEQDATRCLKVRTLAFDSPATAHAAYEAFLPLEVNAYSIGDGGCWTEIGVLFHWGCLVCDIFGDNPSWNSQVQSSLLATYMARRMPPGLPEDPQ